MNENVAIFIKYRPHFVKKNAWHDDVIKWKHFPRYWPFARGIHRSPVNSTHKGQWLGALMLSLICVWTNAWVNNRDAGDLRRYRLHYDVTVMTNSKAYVTMWTSVYPENITYSVNSAYISIAGNSNDVIMRAMASQITSLTIFYSIVNSDGIKENSKAPRHWSLWPVNSPHKGQVTRKMFPFDDVIMKRGFPITWYALGCNSNPVLGLPYFNELTSK